MLFAMKNILILLILFFLLVGCKLKFDGNTFYTIKGRITDTTNHAMPNFKVFVYNYLQGALFVTGGNAVSAVGYTDVNGNFKLTFPACNGDYYLSLQDGFVTQYKAGNPRYPYYYNTQDFQFDTSGFKNYFYNMSNIKVFKP